MSATRAGQVHRNDAWAPLRIPSFRWYLCARTISVLGNGVAPVALAFAVLDLTGSVRDVGLVVAARSLMQVLFLLLGGAVADRWPRNLVLAGSGLAAGLTQAGAAVVVLTDTASVALLVALAAANGTVSALSLPASSALVPQTVPAAMLRQANALARMFTNGALIGGAGLGGVLVAVAGPGWGLAVDAATFVIAAACYTRLRLIPDATAVAPTGSDAVAPESIWRQVREGWAEFRSRTWLWVVVLQFSLVNAAFAGAFVVLGPAIADEEFGRAGWGLIVAAESAGFLIGGLIALRFQPRHALAFGVALMLVAAVPLLGLAYAPTLLVMLPAMVLAGIAIEQFGVAWDVSVQENVPPDRLARVYSLDALGSFIAIPLGQLAAGPLHAHLGPRPTLVGAALLVIVPTLAALATPSVRGLTRRDDTEPHDHAPVAPP